MMTDCGCRYEPWLGIDYATHENVGGNIVYCPRHAAADAMYEALNDIEKYANVSLTSLIDRQEAMGDLNDIIEMARAVLALADGD